MDKITNILSEKKFYNNNKKNLSIQLSVEEAKQLQIEGSLFYDVNQAELADTEMIRSHQFLVHGRLMPIINNLLVDEQVGQPNADTFDFRNPKNWILMLLRPSERSQTNITFDNGNKISLTEGLPLVRVISSEIDNIPKIGFKSILGHDFNVGDIVYINDKENIIPIDHYTILKVEGNNFYIDFTEQLVEEETVTKPSLNSNNPTQELSANPTDATVNFGNIQGLTWISDDPGEIQRNTFANIKYKVFAKKIDNNIPREYYIKNLVVENIINDFDMLGFSKNPYGGDVYQYSFDRAIDMSHTDNKGYLPNKVYVGIAKLAQTGNLPISPVVSYFSNLIDTATENNNLGIISNTIDVVAKYTKETLSETKQVALTNAKIPLRVTGPIEGQQLQYGLVSYSNDSLEEFIINPIEHSFILNPGASEIKFTYKPFVEYTIRQRSPYIESTSKHNEAVPYAYYDTVKEVYRWRDTYEMGYFDLDGLGVEFPFLNGQHYIYGDFIFNLKNLSTPKYSKDYQSKFLDGFFGETIFSIDEVAALFDDDTDLDLDSDNNYINYTGDDN